MNTTNKVLRTYIALARGEHYGPSDLGATVDFVGAYSGRLIDSYPLTQKNWTENEDLREQVCAAWNLKTEEYDRRMIIETPSTVQNLVYSAKLRELFGVGVLRFVTGFDKDGYFILPKGRGFLVPVINKGMIDSLRFYDLGVLRKKAA